MSKRGAIHDSSAVSRAKAPGKGHVPSELLLATGKTCWTSVKFPISGPAADEFVQSSLIWFHYLVDTLHEQPGLTL